jgi:hypothetical protein
VELVSCHPVGANNYKVAGRSGDRFPGVKRPGRGVDHPPPSSAEVKERVELIHLLPLWAFVACSRLKFTLDIWEIIGSLSQGLKHVGVWITVRITLKSVAWDREVSDLL